jgi:hypothetical protein
MQAPRRRMKGGLHAVLWQGDSERCFVANGPARSAYSFGALDDCMAHTPGLAIRSTCRPVVTVVATPPTAASWCCASPHCNASSRRALQSSSVWITVRTRSRNSSAPSPQSSSHSTTTSLAMSPEAREAPPETHRMGLPGLHPAQFTCHQGR